MRLSRQIRKEDATKLLTKISPSSLKDRAAGRRTSSNVNTSMIFLSFCSASEEQKQKGQPHREDSTATTQRNPIKALRISGLRSRRNEASRMPGPKLPHDA